MISTRPDNIEEDKSNVDKEMKKLQEWSAKTGLSIDTLRQI
jgi:hypothetical protein